MKLHLEAVSERGKPVTKSGNNYLEIKITTEREEACTIKVSAETFEGTEFYYIDYYEKNAEVGKNLLTFEKHNGKFYLQDEIPSVNSWVKKRKENHGENCCEDHTRHNHLGCCSEGRK